MRAVVLTINGRRVELPPSPRLTVLDALRDHAGLTGAKKGCARGECGACTVLADGRPIYSCLALAIQHRGAEITTIEGLAGPESLHPVQQAFVAADAVQCGFCTPGQILSVVALLRRHPHPSDEETARALSGNLCRCGTYPKIRRAISIVTSGRRSRAVAGGRGRAQ